MCETGACPLFPPTIIMSELPTVVQPFRRSLVAHCSFGGQLRCAGQPWWSLPPKPHNERRTTNVRLGSARAQTRTGGAAACALYREINISPVLALIAEIVGIEHLSAAKNVAVGRFDELVVEQNRPERRVDHRCAGRDIRV